jgi:hypothetical protein
MSPSRESDWKPVWKSLSPPYQVGRDGFTPAHVVKDEDGWVKADDIKPLPYALCYIRTEKYTRKGWWTSGEWDGARIDKGCKVLYWKKTNECHCIDE